MKTIPCSHCRHETPVVITRESFITSDEDAEPRVVRWALVYSGGSMEEGTALYVGPNSSRTELLQGLQTAWECADRDWVEAAAMDLAMWDYIERTGGPFPVKEEEEEGALAFLLTEAQLTELIAAANAIIESL